ncbi:MAG: 3-oxoacyl-[acyl-carrier-protein] synthase III C-terminal domain-containing protein [Microcella pacifica]|uniref:Type III polyketide synthase n=1 Tax=Microcella pacifica TaxID=2591847 RepID=A0A9E5MK66_9MICO|nr:3-oxoacyl-[acyl-carrier-protein] synthase III C-terminal domain-containing protein [Microcella pacifica]MBR21894.1 type III polyketide synthase [Leifsonia sp.]NHF62749.1 type III polyketide synthase [Microcella pacifica]
MARILSVAAALPDHEHAQEEITAALAAGMAEDDRTRSVMERIHASSGIRTRHLALPLDEYRGLSGFTETNELFVEHALPLAQRSVRVALEEAGLSVDDVDHLFFTTVTGLGAPSLDALLATSMGFRSDLRRVPSFGLGCVAGAAGIARVADYLAGHPEGVALLVSVELCSLTLQWDDHSMANVVGTGIFGDGAAAVVMVGDEHPLATGRITALPRVVGSRSALYPDSAEMIGWQIGSAGFRLMLAAGVPALIGGHFAAGVDELLAEQGWKRDDVDVWIAHPGGPRVLESFADCLELAPAALDISWGVMERTGNMSSAAVLHVLAAVGERPAGDRALLFALGPGVTAELVVLEWS